MSDSNYKISVVTPFHNIEMELFNKTFESMKNQTIKFENIEWIIVVHNCKAGYWDELNSMLGQYPNVKLLELNNDKHTASSPRNFGIINATAPYLGFLDGDDCYTFDALENAITAMSEEKAQAVFFRMEYELNDDIAEPISDEVLWNQCEDRIVITRDNWDTEKMFSGMFGWVTSRLFDRKFLIDNNLLFDEELVIFEDFHLLVRILAEADRVVYLPSTIGYHYNINFSSTLQSVKSGDELVKYAVGLAKLYNLMDELKIDSPFTVRSCAMFAQMMAMSKNISISQRLEIKKLLGDYVDNFKNFQPNKIASPEFVDFCYRFSKEILLNTDDSLENIKVVSELDGQYELIYILHQNQHTDFGEKYKFRDIHSIDEYQISVPLMERSTLQKLVKLQTNIGEKNILSNKHIGYYLINEVGDYIPSTTRHFNSYVNAFASTVQSKRNLLLAYRNNIYGTVNDDADISDLESLLIIKYFTKKYFRENSSKTSFTSPTGVYFDNALSKEQLFYILMRDALLSKDLEQITALNTTQVLFAFEILEDKYKEMLEEISKVDIIRANEIGKILTQGFEKPVAQLLWPNLQRIVAFGSGEVYKSTLKMKRYTGDIPHNNGYYYTEEALLGHAVCDDSDLFEHKTQSADFYELMDVIDESIVRISKAKIDVPYQMIITSESGLYRCPTNHFLRIVNKYPDKIIYTIY